MTVITVRDVPEQVRDALAMEASRRGQSLQAFLRGVLVQRADFTVNARTLTEVGDGFHGTRGGLGRDAPHPADLIHAARQEAGRDG